MSKFSFPSKLWAILLQLLQTANSRQVNAAAERKVTMSFLLKVSDFSRWNCWKFSRWNCQNCKLSNWLVQGNNNAILLLCALEQRPFMLLEIWHSIWFLLTIDQLISGLVWPPFISYDPTVGVNSLLLMTGVEMERIIIMQIYLDRDLMLSKLEL